MSRIDEIANTCVNRILDSFTEWDAEAIETAATADAPFHVAWGEAMRAKFTHIIRAAMEEGVGVGAGDAKQHTALKQFLGIGEAVPLAELPECVFVPETDARMACNRCDLKDLCKFAFDPYNLDTEPEIDCLAAK